MVQLRPSGGGDRGPGRELYSTEALIESTSLPDVPVVHENKHFQIKDVYGSLMMYAVGVTILFYAIAYRLRFQPETSAHWSDEEAEWLQWMSLLTMPCFIMNLYHFFWGVPLPNYEKSTATGRLSNPLRKPVAISVLVFMTHMLGFVSHFLIRRDDTFNHVVVTYWNDRFPVARLFEWNAAITLMTSLLVDLIRLEESRAIHIVVTTTISVVTGNLACLVHSPLLVTVLLVLSIYYFFPLPLEMWTVYKEREALRLEYRRAQGRKGTNWVNKERVFQARIDRLDFAVVLGSFCSFAFSCFPVVFFLSMGGFISDFSAQMCYHVLDICTKSLFTALMGNAYMLEVRWALDDSHLLSVERKVHEQHRHFVRYVFHEVRVPLHNLSLCLDALEHQVDPNSDAAGLMRCSSESVALVADILNTVLSFQKIEDSKVDISKEYFNLRGMIDRVVNSFEATLSRQRKHVAVIMDPSIPSALYADHRLLAQVLSNFLSNAVKFTPIGSDIGIHATCEALDDNFATVRIEVIDHGVGISQEDQDKLWMPYAQVRPGDLQEGRGSGLGLCITKELVALHGGTVGCTSKLGCGSTFYFTIDYPIGHNVPAEEVTFIAEAPFVPSPTDAEMTTAATTSARIGDFVAEPVAFKVDVKTSEGNEIVEPKVPEVLGNSEVEEFVESADSVSKLRVLIVDDSKMTCRLMKVLLERLGLTHIMTAYHGQEALDIIEKHGLNSFHVVLLDNVMPGMTGVQCASKLRELGYKNKIVGITGSALSSELDEFRNSGADVVLSKPVSRNTLQKLINSFIF